MVGDSYRYSRKSREKTSFPSKQRAEKSEPSHLGKIITKKSYPSSFPKRPLQRPKPPGIKDKTEPPALKKPQKPVSQENKNKNLHFPPSQNATSKSWTPSPKFKNSPAISSPQNVYKKSFPKTCPPPNIEASWINECNPSSPSPPNPPRKQEEETVASRALDEEITDSSQR